MESCANNNMTCDNPDEDDDSLVEVEMPVVKRKRRAKETSLPKKKRRVNVTPDVSDWSHKKSPYFVHYVKSQEIDKLKCIYCSILITHKPGNGTSGLKTHINRCKKYPANLDKKQRLINFETSTIVNEDGTLEEVNVPRLWRHDQNFSRKECAKMIIVDELPFVFVEREGFRGLCKALQPEFIPPSRTTVTRDCYGLFIDERAKLTDFFSKLTSRVCLTTDTWTSGQNLCYMCLTAHFIDDNWNLHKRIINFCRIAGHSGEIIGRTIEQCLVEWNVKRVLTCTLDNASANDVAIRYLRSRVNFWKGSVLDGKYLHMRCAAHILNLVVREGLKDLELSILRIRSAVRYVRSSPARAQSFKASMMEVNITSTGLVSLDIETRWNATYLMLLSAFKYKDAFDNLKSKGGAYTRHLSSQYGVPDDNDWEAVKSFLPFLEIFYNATLKVSGSLHVTSNTYVPEIIGVGNLISFYCDHENGNIRSMASRMRAKHDKYWGDVDNINVLLFIALILDPRRKWQFVEWTIKDTYNEESANLLITTIKKCLQSLFESYDTSIPFSTSGGDQASCNLISPAHDGVNKGGGKKVDAQQLLMSRYQKEKGATDILEEKTELDKYLSDTIEQDDPKFDILGWWKDSSKRRYPILGKLAKDVLAMPVSSVASECAFSTGGRVLDSFRTSLTPRIVEALICCQDWLRKSHGPLIIEESLAELEALEESLQELMVKQPEIFIDESIVTINEELGYSFNLMSR